MAAGTAVLCLGCHQCISAAATRRSGDVSSTTVRKELDSHGFSGTNAAAALLSFCQAVMWGLHPNSSTTTVFAGAAGSASAAGELQLQAPFLFSICVFQYAHLRYTNMCISQTSSYVEQRNIFGVTDV